MKNTKRVPKRRFKEFLGADAWEQRKLEDISEKVTEKNIHRIYAETLTNSAEYGIISQRDFFDKDISNNANLGGYYVVEDNDFVYNPRISTTAPVGPIKRNKLGRTGVMSPLYYVFKTHDIDNTYLETYFSSTGWHGFMKLNGDSGARADRFAIKDSVFCKMPIPYPKFTEQKNIGCFFAHLDNLITLHQRKYDKLKALKSAYLSEMFPQEGEKVPKRRFSGFTDDWEQRKVELLCSISTGKSNTQDKIEGGRYPFYVRSPIIEHSNKYLYDEEAVLTVGDGVGTGKVFHYVNGKYDLHQRVYRMFGFENNILAKFFYYYFSWHFYERVMAMTAKTSVDSVRYEMIGNMEILYPSIEEQNKIVAVFSNLDNLITLHQRKLEKLRNLKAAYLQEMFV